MATLEDIRGWTGKSLIGQDDELIGAVQNVYVDEETEEPSFVSVKTGLFGIRSSLVPIAGASRHDDHIHVAFTKDQVKDAPNLDEDEELSPSEEQRLYAHYNMGGSDRTRLRKYAATDGGDVQNEAGR
jgi:PRC-barrel domain